MNYFYDGWMYFMELQKLGTLFMPLQSWKSPDINITLIVLG